MSYKKGDLKMTVPQCGHENCAGGSECIETQERFFVSDAREPYVRWDDPNRPPTEKYGAYLPHSCDEWFIGGRAEVEQMIADLTAALEVLP